MDNNFLNARFIQERELVSNLIDVEQDKKIACELVDVLEKYHTTCAQAKLIIALASFLVDDSAKL